MDQELPLLRLLLGMSPAALRAATARLELGGVKQNFAVHGNSLIFQLDDFMVVGNCENNA